MLKACAYCGRVHDSKFDCGKKPVKKYKRKKEETGRYTHAWNMKAKEIKEKSNYLCSVCLDENILTCKELETHHVVKLVERPDLLLEDENLICLCKTHHFLADNGKISNDYLRVLISKRDE